MTGTPGPLGALTFPPQRELEGQTLPDLKDVNSKLFVRAHLRAVAGEGGAGWSHYMWPRPGETVPSCGTGSFRQVVDIHWVELRSKQSLR